MPKSVFIYILFFFSAVYLPAQDIQFSQFYTALLYQNPAFAGSNHQYRGSFHQRVQWPGLDAKYITSMISFDTYSKKYNSGVGLMVFKDWQGSNNINSLDVGLQYAYELHITNQLTFRPGLQISYVSRTPRYADLTLPQDYDKYGQIGFGGHFPNFDPKQYADFSSGGILYTDKIWVGFSAHHMSRPNQSYLGDISKLPAKFAFTGGYKINLKNKSPYKSIYNDHEKEYSLTPTFHYKFQGKSDQFDIGLYGIYDYMLIGLWYRGIPLKYYSKEAKNNNESIIAMIGIRINQLSITYSYDFTVSKLVRAGTGGSHELNLTYPYAKKKRHKIMKRLPCPNFNHR